MARYGGPIVDVDIHHRWQSDDEIVAYLPKRWQEYVRGDLNGGLYPLAPPGTSVSSMIAHGGRRADSFPDNGSRPASNYELTRQQLLDRYGLYRGILTFDTGSHVGHSNPYFSTALARAVNDWNLDTWLSFDERLYGLVLPPIGQPEEAAKEIRRIGKHPKIVGILLPGTPFGRPYGDPIYHPVYEAAAEMGLSVVLHPSVTGDRPNISIAFTGGIATGSIEGLSLISQAAMHHVTSFVTHGVFEKFPYLHVVVTEYGVAWLPYVMWRLDRNYDLLRIESPWVKKWPSEYIQKNIRLSTQPIEESPDPKDFQRVISSVDGMADMLCFSTDYPHFTFDDPDYVARRLPSGWVNKIMCENACSLYGWTVPTEGRADNQLSRTPSAIDT